MKYLLLYIKIILFTFPAIASAKDGTVSAAAGWNNSAGLQTSYDKLVKLTTAEAIEMQTTLVQARAESVINRKMRQF